MSQAIEILAPAGSVETMRAALKAGADAVYMGGSRFGARAYADNPDETALLSAIDEVHIQGKKLYMTVNTLLKDREMDELYGYLLPYYREGLDGVIVQDLGVLDRLREWFPKLPLHASTQMTLTGWEEAVRLKKEGVCRIVPSRELSLKEIRHIHDRVKDMEIEVFVHGALCYCYSGQCLMSSFIGGRSGNRGRCAQPCRLPYRVEGGQAGYLLSPKDICALDDIPDLAEAGVASFKIEGRMKKPEYAALVAFMYRRYTDMYMEKGRAGFRVDPEDIKKLMDLYNRGGFSGGYFHMWNGPSMISAERPNHMGVKVGEPAGDGRFRAVEDIAADDVLECRFAGAGKSFCLGQSVKKGGCFVLPGRQNERGKSGKRGDIYRTRNPKLIRDTLERFAAGSPICRLNGRLTAKSGEPLSLSIWPAGQEDQTVTVAKEPVMEALNRPTLPEELEKQVRKTGGSGFVFEDLKIVADGAGFVPVKTLNALRREALEATREKRTEPFRRSAPDVVSFPGKKPAPEPEKRPWELYIQLPDAQSGRAHMERPEAAGFYLEADTAYTEEGRGFIRACHQAGKTVYVALPHILRERDKPRVEGQIKALDGLADGWLFRNMETLDVLKRLRASGKFKADHHVYAMNQAAKESLKRAGADQLTAPLELNRKELAELGCGDMELMIYGYPVLMISAQCIQKTTRACTKRPEMIQLTDRQHKRFYARNVCAGCYNLIYNGSPIRLTDLTEDIAGLAIASARVVFTFEDIEEQTRLLDDLSMRLKGVRSGAYADGTFTRGHFKRGIE